MVSGAAAQCAAIGGRLPLPLNEQENDDLLEAANSMLNNNLQWMVLGIRDVNDAWRDVDGKEVSYTNWGSGQPDSKSQDFVFMHNQGKWFDWEGIYTWPVICQQDKPDCCTADEIVLECSPEQVDLEVPTCFYEQQGFTPSTIIVGANGTDSMCQGAVDGLFLLFSYSLRILFF